MSVIDPQTWRDAEDGRALRELREALPDDRAVECGASVHGWWVNVVDLYFGGDVHVHSEASTFAAAADACRASLK